MEHRHLIPLLPVFKHSLFNLFRRLRLGFCRQQFERMLFLYHTDGFVRGCTKYIYTFPLSVQLNVLPISTTKESQGTWFDRSRQKISNSTHSFHLINLNSLPEINPQGNPPIRDSFLKPESHNFDFEGIAYLFSKYEPIKNAINGNTRF